MQSNAATVDEYLAALPDERRAVMTELRDAINKRIPKGFEEAMGYGMAGWVVPHSLYPDGYHCDPRQPVPFMGIASQKNHIAVYHMGLYSSEKLMEWFRNEWPKHSAKKLDMGKSCIRFKRAEDVPVALIAELASKMTPQQWIDVYESFKPAKKGKK
ncbi:MAG: iron chaperone [Pyrinomonadaceae bacterium]